MEFIKQCTICKSKNIGVLYKNTKDYHTNIQGRYTIYSCMNCGLYFLNPMMTNEELSKCYEGDYYSYEDYIEQSRIGLLRKLWRKFIKIKTYTPELVLGSKILDIGCGSGDWLHLMKNKGYCVKGCEVSEAAAKLGKRLSDIDIFAGQLTDSNFDSGEFDFIRLNHPFEHMNNPNETLDEIYRILRKCGTLFIGVPNTNSLCSKIFKEKWYYIGAPIHVYNYNDKNLCDMLTKHGFSVKKVRYNGNYYGIVGSIEIMAKGKSKGGLKILYPFFYLIAKIFNLLKMGDCIEIIAVKQ